MKKQRLICSIMAVLMFAMMTPAFAVEGAEAGQTAQADTNLSLYALEEAVIDVSVPTTGKLYINPLKFPVHYEYDGEEVTDNSQIISEPGYIENLGDTAVRVSVSVTAEPHADSTLGLSSAPVLSQATTSKKAFIYYELQAVSDPNGKISWASEYDAEKHVIARGTRRKKNIVELESAGGRNCYGAFRLTGDCVAKPRTPWTEDDGVTVTIAYTFDPIIEIS